MGKRAYFLAPITMAAPISTVSRRRRLQEGPRSVRLVKDVLRIGRWKTGDDSVGFDEFWNVTPAVLHDLSRNFHLARARGFRPTLQVTHNPRSDDDLLAYIDELKVLGDRLWMSAVVTPAQAEFLRSPSMLVSVRADPDWTDPKGFRYPVVLNHVAVTDRPCVTGQQPFRVLSAGWPVNVARASTTRAVALSSSSRATTPQSSQAAFNDRFQRAEELAKRRGISVAAAMTFIPR